MPSVTLSQLRNTRQLMAWLKAGETVLLLEGGRVIARIIPETHAEDPTEQSSEER